MGRKNYRPTKKSSGWLIAAADFFVMPIKITGEINELLD